MGETWKRRAAFALASLSFSILERIDVGETRHKTYSSKAAVYLSVSSNGSTWVKRSVFICNAYGKKHLSVSSNGSTWVKLTRDLVDFDTVPLSVSSNGSTWVKLGEVVKNYYLNIWLKTFSILERIDVGETLRYIAASRIS